MEIAVQLQYKNAFIRHAGIRRKGFIEFRKCYFLTDPWKVIKELVTYYNHQRYHESLDNLTPEDVYFGRVEEVKSRRELIKEKTLKTRRVENLQTVCI